MDDDSSSLSTSSSSGGNGSSDMRPMPFASMLGKKHSEASSPDGEEALVAMGGGGSLDLGQIVLSITPWKHHHMGSDEPQHNQERQLHHRRR